MHQDFGLFIEGAWPTKFANCGQVCVTPDRFFIHESLHDEFVDGFVARASKIKLGDGLDEVTAMGPLINAGRLSEVDRVVLDAVAQGASLALGGNRAAGFNEGDFFEPTKLATVSEEVEVFVRKNFNPDAAIASFKEEDGAFVRANASLMGLSAYAFTQSPARARRAVAVLKSGMVRIKSFALAVAEAPFRGTNFSGLGSEGGTEGIEDYLDTKLAQVVF